MYTILGSAFAIILPFSCRRNRRASSTSETLSFQSLSAPMRYFRLGQESTLLFPAVLFTGGRLDS